LALYRVFFTNELSEISQGHSKNPYLAIIVKFHFF
jgi:hypothetical protein